MSSQMELMTAIQEGKPASVRQAIEAGADVVTERSQNVEYKYGDEKVTPIGWAAYHSSKIGIPQFSEIT